jgi:DinB superfamily
VAETQDQPSGAPAQPAPPPPPPPPIQPVAGVDEAREGVASATAGLEATMQRAAALADEDRHRQVNDEWSTVESLRHVVFVVDLWLSKVVLGEPDPFDPMGLPPTFMPARFPDSSIDPEARPSFDEVCQVLAGRLARLSTYVDGLTPEELDRPIKAHAGTVAGALSVIFTELKAHTRFINRDLDLITA